MDCTGFNGEKSTHAHIGH